MHPYRSQPARAFWSRTVASVPWAQVQFEARPHRIVRADTRIATAGSCFASNLLRWMPRLGLTPFFTEEPPPYFTPAEAAAHGYGEFGARYGNLYTVRQLRQLVEQALGLRPMVEELDATTGGVYDLLRPHVRPGGFVSAEEARLDRAYHLECVRRLLLESEVFVFTLGLTEAWVNERTGVVYPVCPGTAAGTFDPAVHRPVNFDYVENLDDLLWVVDTVHGVNPGLEWVITVSPVPLVATHTDQSVITATVYSKSVLRAVCGAVEQAREHVTYFPSYEIISSAQSFGQYLGSDLREITNRGLEHVMAVFERVFVDRGDDPLATPRSASTSASAPPSASAAPAPFERVAAAVAAECDELLNDV
jgi:hypothetical protein